MKDLIEIRNKKHHSGAWILKHGEHVDIRLLEILEKLFARKVSCLEVQRASGNRVTFKASVAAPTRHSLDLGAFTLLETEVKKITGEMVIESHFESSNGVCPVLIFGSYVRVYYK